MLWQWGWLKNSVELGGCYRQPENEFISENRLTFFRLPNQKKLSLWRCNVVPMLERELNAIGSLKTSEAKTANPHFQAAYALRTG